MTALFIPLLTLLLLFSFCFYFYIFVPENQKWSGAGSLIERFGGGGAFTNTHTYSRWHSSS